MTNSEKIELRERALRLSLELPDTTPILGKKTSSWAEEIYQFLSKDIDHDPLRLDSPSPVWKYESEMSPEEYWKLHSEMHGVDWSRPQIVIGIDEYYGVKLKTNGDNDSQHFTGRHMTRGTANSNMWPKKSFVYYGEIPEKISAKEAEIDWDRPQLVESRFSGCIVRTNGIHNGGAFEGVVIKGGRSVWPKTGDKEYEWVKSNFIYCGEIPEGKCANDTDGDRNCGRANCICAKKTTSLNFTEAMEAVFSGEKVRRALWTGGVQYMQHANGIVLIDINGHNAVLSKYDLRATDWEIV